MKLSLKTSLNHHHLTYYLGSPSEHLKNRTPECHLEITEKQASKGNSRCQLAHLPCPKAWSLHFWCSWEMTTVYSICSLFSQISLCLEELHSKWNKTYSLSKHHSGHNTPLQTPPHKILHPPLQNSLTKAERQEKVSPSGTTTCYFLKRRKLDLLDLEHSRQTHVWVLTVSAKHLQTAYLSHFASGNWSRLMKVSSSFSKLPTHTSLVETAKRTKLHLWKFFQTESKWLATDRLPQPVLRILVWTSSDLMIQKKTP